MNRMRSTSAAIAVLLLCWVDPTPAQVRLPSVDLPQLPVVTDTLDGTSNTVDRTLQSVDPQDLRRVQVQGLLRRHRDVLERDPHGEPVIRRELLAFEPTAEAVRGAQAAGFTVAREERMEELGTRIVVLLAPPRMSLHRALRELRSRDPTGTYDYNHVYTGSGSAVADAAAPAPVLGEVTGAPIRVGLIDGGVQPAHAAFAKTTLHASGCEGALVPSPHGTAVASLMAMQAATRRLELFSADVYCNQPTGGAVTTLAGAFLWLSRERVPVINVSLVGPPNRLLEKIVQTMLARGHVIVAAVGNDGPNAKPLYPAAYDGVVGVTGVDRRQRVLIEALRGPQVDFAAAGADLAAATVDNAYANVRGTSFASPIVAVLMAAEQTELQPGAAATLVARFAPLARDLGKPGLDPIYGHGLLATAPQIFGRRRE